MISAADFADVFPWMIDGGASIAIKRHSAPQDAIATPRYDECIARWEDDGGETWQPASRQPPPTIEARP